jgi:hypothetical protein
MKSNKTTTDHGGRRTGLDGTSFGTFGEEERSRANRAASGLELTVEKEEDFTDSDDEDDEERVESWGVYVSKPEKVLIGLFWDKKIAQFFQDAIQDSPLIANIQSAAEGIA